MNKSSFFILIFAIFYLTKSFFNAIAAGPIRPMVKNMRKYLMIRMAALSAPFTNPI
jgi:hypothetical protein